MASGDRDSPTGPSAPSDRDLPGLSETRGEIFDLVRDEPGITIASIADELEEAHSTVRYHLDKLAQAGLIEQVRDGRSVRQFDANQDTLIKKIAPILRDDRRTRIVEHIAAQSLRYKSINEIADELDLDHGLVKRTLVKLEEAGYVALEKRRGRFRIKKKRDLSELLDG